MTKLAWRKRQPEPAPVAVEPVPAPMGDLVEATPASIAPAEGSASAVVVPALPSVKSDAEQARAAEVRQVQINLRLAAEFRGELGWALENEARLEWEAQRPRESPLIFDHNRYTL